MPVYLEPRDVTAKLEDFGSVLIVSCPVCPAMSLAMQKKEPFIDLFRHGLKTPAFEDYIESVREPLEERGIRTGAFSIRTPSPFLCLWTEGQRRRLRERAGDYEAVVVLGCDSAINTVKDTLKDTDCQILPAMRMKGTANATTKFGFPPSIEFEMHQSKKDRGTGRREGSAGASSENGKEAS